MNRNRVILSLAALAAVILLIYLYFTTNLFRRSDPMPHDVTYLVRGNAGVALVTYTTADGEATEPEFVSIPWRVPTIRYHEPTMVVLTAHNSMQYGDVECVILLDGKEWVTDKVSSPGLNASCGGFVP